MNKPYILAEGLAKVYPGGVIALDGVSFSVGEKGIVGLVGPNGAGKTTLIKILTTLTRPTRGRAEVLGYDVEREYEEVRRRVSLVPQDASPELYLTPYEHVYWYLRSRGLPRGDAEKLAREALEALGLWEVRNRVCARLSGGTRQRVLIASALAVPAEVYFLDEPTVGLDPIARREVWKVLRGAARNSLVFLTTHYMEEAESLSDLVVMINKGRIVEMGNPRELLGKVRHRYRVVLDRDADTSSLGLRVLEAEDGKIIYAGSEGELSEVVGELARRRLSFSVRATSLEDLFIMRVSRYEG
ncbi:MAG: ABC transporter ATP-binding protein [Thermofilum sp.]|nr:ABC transporter ATP-binding protein [Thermofilum sp.]